MDISKLPKWAQEHISNLERQKDTAIKALNDYCDDQTESAFFFSDNLCTGENNGPTEKIKYIQAYKLSVIYEGVYLEVMLRDKCIELSWSNKRYGAGEVACIPSSYQQARLVSKDNMR